HGLLDEKHGNTTHAGATGAHGNGKVVGPDAVGNPLLLAVHNEVLAIFGLLGSADKVSNVGARIRLGNGETDALIAGKNAGHDALLESLRAEFEDRWETNSEATNDVPDETTAARPAQFVRNNQLMEVIPVFRCHASDTPVGVFLHVVSSAKAGEVAALTHFLVNLLRDTLSLIPLGDKRLDLFLDPLADLLAQGNVRGIVVGRVLLRLPTLASRTC